MVFFFFESCGQQECKCKSWEREGEREAQKEQILWTRTISLIPLPLNITVVTKKFKMTWYLI